MKCFMVANFFLLVLLCFGLNVHHLQWPILFLVFFFLFLSLLFLNSWVVPGGFAWRNHKATGPIGLPLIGNLLDQMSSLAHRRFASLANKHGAKRLMALSLGATRVAISSHPETAKEILFSPSFSDRPLKESARLLMFERAIGFAPSGTYWRRLRRIAANNMFSPKRISSLELLRHRLADEMLEGVSNYMNESGFVELRGLVQRASLSNVVESVFGNGFCVEREEEFNALVREGYELIGKFNWEDYFPLGFMDFNGVKRRCLKLAVRVKSLVGNIIEERKREKDLCGRNDFLSILLSLPSEDQLSDEDMVAVLWEMIFRGTDAVAVLLEWIMARMVLHQDIQQKVQDELDTCVGHHRHMQDSDIPNLPYLQSTIKEVLRLHPPGPLLSWARLAVHDVHVDKVFVPAGTTAMVNMWAITHDRSVWPDPWTFRPERFMEENVSIMGSDLRLAPFGSGRRVCPGRVLGLGTVQLWVGRMLQRYTWMGNGGNVDLSERLKLSLEMKTPLTCCVIPRTQL